MWKTIQNSTPRENLSDYFGEHFWFAQTWFSIDFTFSLFFKLVIHIFKYIFTRFKSQASTCAKGCTEKRASSLIIYLVTYQQICKYVDTSGSLERPDPIPEPTEPLLAKGHSAEIDALFPLCETTHSTPMGNLSEICHQGFSLKLT